MKFKIQGDMEFNADTPDEALLKVGLYFIAQMESRPIMMVDNLDKLPEPRIALDVIRMLCDITPGLLQPGNVTGEVGVAMKDVFETPRTIQ